VNEKITTYEQLEERILSSVKEKMIPGITKEFLDSEKMKGLFEDHEKLIAQGADVKAMAEKKVPLAQAARFQRALYAKDTVELAKIQAEELPKWIAKIGGKTITYMNETTPAQGGYLVPTEYYEEIMKIDCEYGIARRDCRIIPMNRLSIDIPTLLTRPTAYWIGEGEQKVESKPTFSKVTLTAVKLICLIVMSDELLADATPPIMQFIIELVRNVIAMNEDDALFNGNGGAGIAGTLSCGTQVTMDKNRQAFSQIHTDDILKLVNAVVCGARKGGKFYFNYNTLTWLRTLKTTTGAYILNESPVAGQPPTLWNFPYETSDVMPADADSLPNTPFIVFGDFKKTVALGDRQTLVTSLSNEATIDGTNLFEYDMTAIRFVERLDIECLLPTGITVLYTAP